MSPETLLPSLNSSSSTQKTYPFRTVLPPLPCWPPLMQSGSFPLLSFSPASSSFLEQQPTLQPPPAQQQQRPGGVLDASNDSAAWRGRLTTTLWEDEDTICYQMEARGLCVSRRQDNNFINGTKLLNVVGMSRGKRDGVLKNERIRHVIKVGSMHLKGVWIPFERAKILADQYHILNLLLPLFAQDPTPYLENLPNMDHLLNGRNNFSAPSSSGTTPIVSNRNPPPPAPPTLNPPPPPTLPSLPHYSVFHDIRNSSLAKEQQNNSNIVNNADNPYLPTPVRSFDFGVPISASTSGGSGSTNCGQFNTLMSQQRQEYPFPLLLPPPEPNSSGLRQHSQTRYSNNPVILPSIFPPKYGSESVGSKWHSHQLWYFNLKRKYDDISSSMDHTTSAGSANNPPIYTPFSSCDSSGDEVRLAPLLNPPMPVEIPQPTPLEPSNTANDAFDIKRSRIGQNGELGFNNEFPPSSSSSSSSSSTSISSITNNTFTIAQPR